MISITSFAFHVTYTCPLACAHCCFHSSPKVKDKLDIDLILQTIDELDDSIKMVCFTGGEPFLLGADLPKLVRQAANKGYSVRIVTSGYFASSIDIALKRLRPLIDSGLNELSISWDDFHEEFVDFSCIRNLVAAADTFPNLLFAMNVVSGLETRWTLERLQSELGQYERLKIVQTPVNLTGRAVEKLSGIALLPDRYLGPCPFVLTGPTLSAKGHLLACCGVIPDTSRLYIAPSFLASELPNLLESAKCSPLFQWLYLRGPYAIIEWIGQQYEIDVPGASSVGGNCEACKILFETPAIEAHLDDAAAAMSAHLTTEMLLLESLGLDEFHGRATLWSTA